jgi:O-antigen/teichoic acid export membrane protein
VSLARKAAHGMVWVTISAIITKVLGFVTSIILARLLAPADFGLLAIGLLAINTMGIFRDLGFGAALIYKKDDSNHAAADTAFILLPVVASILFALAYLSAPSIAIFFNNTETEPIIRVLALTFVISSLGTVPSMLLEKELEFKKKVLPEVLPQVGYAVVTIGLALYGYGVWSLVYGQIVSAVLTAGLIWMVTDWRPSFRFNKGVARELFGYGKHILGASVLIFLITNIDSAIVGKMLGMEALGFYTLAATIANLPATQITFLISRVMFPAYSKLQDDTDAMKNAYLKTLKYVSMLSIPAAFGIFVLAQDFVRVVLGERWMPAVPALQVLCFYGLMRSISATTGNVFQAKGKPQIVSKFASIQLLAMSFIIYPLTSSYGIFGTSIAVTVPAVIIHLYGILLVCRIFDENVIDVFKVVSIPLAGSIIMAIFIYFIKYFIYYINLQPILYLVILIIFGSIFYIGYSFVFDKQGVQQIVYFSNNFKEK